MKVMIISKAHVVAAYRRKLSELSRLGLEVVAIVPPYWKEGGRRQRLEPGEDAGYELIVSPMRWNGHFHLHYYPEVPRLVRDHSPDLIHMDEEAYNLATWHVARACRLQGIPFVFYTWQNLARTYPPPFRQMERSVYRRAAQAIAGSQDAAMVLRRKGYRGGISVVPQFGIDPDLFSPGPSADRPYTVGFLNRLIPGKAPLLALRAFSQLPADARMLIVGDGPLREEVAQEISRLGLDRRVEMRERVPSSAMPDILRSLSVVVLPSISTPTWKEQFGRVLIEAMACGVPVVGSDSGEIPVVIGDAGLVVKEGSEEELARALRRLYDDPTLRGQLAEKARLRALRRFTHGRIAELTLDAYRHALGHVSLESKLPLG